MKYRIIKERNLFFVQESKFFGLPGTWKTTKEQRKDGSFPRGFFGKNTAENYIDYVKAKRE